VIKYDLPLLRLTEPEYVDVILMKAAQQCESSRRLLNAIKLYNLAGAQDTVMSCLSRALGELLSEPGGGGDEGKELEELASNVLRYYENNVSLSSNISGGDGFAAAAAVLGTGSGRLGREGEDVKKLIRIRWAMAAYEKGDLDSALNVRHLIFLSLNLARLTFCLLGY
jgi:nuclear pore complex protein Nup93